MSRHARKALLLALKAALAAVLLAWIIGQVHWHDYVVIDGESRAVLDVQPSRTEPRRLLLATGPIWRPAPEWRDVDKTIEPVADGSILRPGLASSLRTLDLALMAGAVLCVAGSVLVAAFRWQLLLRVQDVEVGNKETVKLAFLATFFGEVALGAIGGDVIKAYHVAKHTPKKSAVLTSVIMDRLMGVCGFCALAAAALAVAWAGSWMRPQHLVLPAVSVLVIAAGVAAAAALLWSRRLRKALRLWHIVSRLPFGRHLAGADSVAERYRHSGGAMFRAGGLTFVAQVLSIISVLLIGRALGLPAPWYSYFLCVPLVTIISAVPLTPGAVGVSENLYVLYLAAVGNPSAVLALALLVRAASVLCALPGAVIAVLGPKLPSADAAREELELPDEGAAGGAARDTVMHTEA